MISTITGQFFIILPEFGLTLLALLSQLVAVIFGSKSRIIAITTIIAAIILCFVTLHISCKEAVGFSGSFSTNYYTGLYKTLILAFTVITIIVYNDYCKLASYILKSEVITLILLSTVGIFIAISARNFMLLFCGMELQALSAYALAALSRDNVKASEGALKYFILGALISCLSLFGISFIYGFGNSLAFNVILAALNQTANLNIGVVIGIVLFLSSVFFKLSSVPLHSWAPDVYEGSQVSTVMYFATVSKIGMVALLLNLIILVIGDYKQISIDLIKIMAIFSMIVGAFGAIRQTSLKRLMAYSTILNIGYVLMAIALHETKGNFAAMLYILIYVTGVIGFFSCLIILLGKKSDEATFVDISGIAYKHKVISGVITIIMFSMIGIPPLAGFFGKYYLFYQAIIKQEFLLVIIGILTSVIAAYYYLKVIKAMYFVPVRALDTLSHNAAPTGLLVVNSLVIGFILFFAFFIPF